MNDQKISVGRIVHHVNAGRDHLAAIVILEGEDPTLNVFRFDGSTMTVTAKEQQPGDGELEQGTWHWPERV